jgi:hypothetical protein
MMGRWLLFVSSYSPLFALTAIRLDAGVLRTLLYCLAGLGAVGLAVIFAAAWRIEPRERVYVTVEDRGADVAGYLATYLVPFLTVSKPTTRDVVAYALFLCLVGVVYVRSTLIGVNPLAYLFRFQLFSVKDMRGASLLLIARRRPDESTPVSFRLVLPGLGILFPNDDEPTQESMPRTPPEDTTR